MASSTGKEIVMITGCSEGSIGNALACAFVSAGCLVVATSRSLSSMVNLSGDPRFVLLELNVLSDDSVNSAVSKTLEALGCIDVLINSAGVHLIGPLAEVPMPSIEHVFDTNVYGPMRLIQAVAPHMIDRRKGKIVNVGSVTAMVPGPWAGAYSASKSALHALTDTLRLELRSFGISVINVVPGAIRSNIANNATVTYNHMSDWKFYKAYEDVMRGRINITTGRRATPVELLAEKTVSVVLKKQPPAWFLYGHLSTLFRIVYYLPLCVSDYIYGFTLKC